MKSHIDQHLESNNSSKTEYFSEIGHDWDNIVGNDDTRVRAIGEVFHMIDIEQNNTVLDVGCGNGVLIPIIQSYIGHNGKIIAVDAAAGMIETAKKKHGHFGNIQFRVDSIETIDLPENHVDIVLCFAVFPHIDHKEAALTRFHEILKPGGALYIFHMSDTRSLNDFHDTLDAPVRGDHMPERDALETLLKKASFSMEKYIDQEGLNFAKAIPMS